MDFHADTKMQFSPECTEKSDNSDEHFLKPIDKKNNPKLCTLSFKLNNQIILRLINNCTHRISLLLSVP